MFPRTLIRQTMRVKNVRHMSDRRSWSQYMRDNGINPTFAAVTGTAIVGYMAYVYMKEHPEVRSEYEAQSKIQSGRHLSAADVKDDIEHTFNQ